MLWVLTTAAIAVGGSLFQLGALSVWVVVLSLAVRVLALAGLVLVLVLCGGYAWRRWFA